MGRHSHKSGFGRGLRSGLFTVLLISLLAIAVGIGVVPKVLDGAALTVLTGSMEPTYEPGDIVVTVPRDSYAIGDAVTFQPESGKSTLITHRVVAVRQTPEGTGYVTRGDANGADDEPIVAAQVMGKVIYSVPKLGYVQEFIGTNRGLVTIGVGLALLGYGAFALASGVMDKRLARRTANSSSVASTSTQTRKIV